MKEKLITDPKEWMEARGIPYSPELFTGYMDHPPVADEDIKLLAPLLTNLAQPIFGFTSLMPQEVGAAAMTRYSRAKNPLRMILSDEFMSGEGMHLEKAVEIPELVDRSATIAFFARILADFGDDSPSQLGGMQLATEMVSQLTVKEIEDTRIGAAFIEKSSRYVDFTKKVNGYYLYGRPMEIRSSQFAGEYEALMNEAFDLYAQSVQVLLPYVRSKFPMKEGEDVNVYKAATRGKAFDIGRVFLPMATLTNMGGFFDAQALESTLNKMLTSPLEESRWVAVRMNEEADKVIPALIQRVGGKYGEAARNFLSSKRDKIQKEASRLGLGREVARESKQSVKLTYASPDNVDRVVAGILFGFTQNDEQVAEEVRKLSIADKQAIIEADFAGRTNRRHKPSRAFERPTYEFRIVSKVAEWRDLQRMRMNTLQRHLLTTEMGWVTPPEFYEIRVQNNTLADLYEAHMQKRSELFRKIAISVSPEAAQAVVAFGSLMEWEIGVNLRQLYHLIPLRAGPGSHPDYRRIALDMFLQLPLEDGPITLPMTKYLDFKTDDRLDRLDQLRRVREKLTNLGGNPNSDTFNGD